MKDLIEKIWDENTCGVIEQDKRLNKDEYYDQLSKNRYDEYLDIKKYAPFNDCKNKKVLEVGLGAGCDAAELIKGGAEYYGIDVTQNSVDFVKERLGYSFNLITDNISKNDATSIMPAEPNSPKFRAVCGEPPSFTRTKKVPIIDITIPTAAKANGR